MMVNITLNDIPGVVSSSSELFDVDTKIMRIVKTEEMQFIFQNDLEK